MLVETCLRKGLRLKAHRVAAVREDGDVIVAEIERIGRRRLRCGGCGGGVQHTAGRRPPRRWRDLRLRDRPLVLAYQPYRVRFGRCGVRVEQVPWAAQWARVTTALARAVALLARKLSWAEVAAHFGLDWKTVAAIIREAVAQGLQLRRWRPLHVLGIDEVSRAKGQRYLRTPRRTGPARRQGKRHQYDPQVPQRAAGLRRPRVPRQDRRRIKSAHRRRRGARPRPPANHRGMPRLRCFVAIAFGKSDTDLVYSRVIRPALKANGVVPIRVDQSEHNKNINDYIMDQLRKSHLAVADLTYARPSVYYEAGYAERSIPVIYTARQDHFRARDDDPSGNLVVHFDVSMRNIVRWKESDYVGFRRSLERRLRYVLRPLLAARAATDREQSDEAAFRALTSHERGLALSQAATSALLEAGFVLDAEAQRLYGGAVQAARTVDGRRQAAVVLATPRVTRALAGPLQLAMLSVARLRPDSPRVRHIREDHLVVVASEAPVPLPTMRRMLPRARADEDARELLWEDHEPSSISFGRRAPERTRSYRLAIMGAIRSPADLQARLNAKLTSVVTRQTATRRRRR